MFLAVKVKDLDELISASNKQVLARNGHRLDAGLSQRIESKNTLLLLK